MRLLLFCMAAVLLLLVSCNAVMRNDANESAQAWTIQTPNNRTVTCVSWHWGYAGGLSCDWEHSQ